MTFAPQKLDVVVLLEVQLRGEDEWLRVKIRCPLRHPSSNRTQLSPACEWKRLTWPRYHVTSLLPLTWYLFTLK